MNWRDYSRCADVQKFFEAVVDLTPIQSIRAAPPSPPPAASSTTVVFDCSCAAGESVAIPNPVFLFIDPHYPRKQKRACPHFSRVGTIYFRSPSFNNLRPSLAQATMNCSGSFNAS